MKERIGRTMAERAMNLAREMTLFGHMKGTQMTGLAALLVAFAGSEISRHEHERSELILRALDAPKLDPNDNAAVEAWAKTAAESWIEAERVDPLD